MPKLCKIKSKIQNVDFVKSINQVKNDNSELNKQQTLHIPFLQEYPYDYKKSTEEIASLDPDMLYIFGKEIQSTYHVQ